MHPASNQPNPPARSDCDRGCLISEPPTQARDPTPRCRIPRVTADLAPGQVAAGVTSCNAVVPGGVTARTHSQVTALFGGLPLVAPGVVPVTEWRPQPASATPCPADLYAGLARTPRNRM